MNKGNIAFALPYGRIIGGPITWSFQMAAAAEQAGYRAVLLEHEVIKKSKAYLLDAPEGISCIVCPALHEVSLKKRDILSLSVFYAQALPAVFIPNTTVEAYAACAQLAVRYSDAMRIVGVAHGQSDYYIHLLSYYERVIHKFIAVSDEISVNLKQAIPHRANDVYMRACAVVVPPALSRGYSADGAPLMITYAGRITNHEKRVYKLLPLAEALQKRGVNFHLRIIGDGGFRWGLNKAIGELPPELRQRIALEDPVSPEELATVWDQTDVCVLVSDKEGTAVSMLEAMAHGCVPVVTRVSGTAAVIDHGVNGFVADIDDLETMADHIAKLASNRKLLAVCGKRGYEKISAKYSLSDYMTWFLPLIAETWTDAPRAWDTSRSVIMPAVRSRGMKKNISILRGFIRRQRILWV